VPCYFLIFETGGNVVVPLSESSILRGALKLRALIPVSGKSVNDFLCIMKSGTCGEKRDTRDWRERRDMGGEFEVRRSRSPELRTQNFEFRVRPVSPVPPFPLVARSGLAMTNCLC
jgi:hypothetical protein